MELPIRLFFVTFTARCIQSSDCTKFDDALVKARGMVADQEDNIDSFLKNFVKEWDIDSSGLTLITKPIRHELFYDPAVPTHYGLHWPMNKRNNKYDIGSAIIHIPIASLRPTITFTNDDFVHGHITDGKINCWGKYESIQKAVLTEGPLSALTAMYGFCKYSRYGSYLRSTEKEPSNV